MGHKVFELYCCTAHNQRVSLIQHFFYFGFVYNPFFVFWHQNEILETRYEIPGI